MKFKTISIEELETLPFDDIAYIILKEKGKKKKLELQKNQTRKLINWKEGIYEPPKREILKWSSSKLKRKI